MPVVRFIAFPTLRPYVSVRRSFSANAITIRKVVLSVTVFLRIIRNRASVINTIMPMVRFIAFPHLRPYVIMYGRSYSTSDFIPADCTSIVNTQSIMCRFVFDFFGAAENQTFHPMIRFIILLHIVMSMFFFGFYSFTLFAFVIRTPNMVLTINVRRITS